MLMHIYVLTYLENESKDERRRRSYKKISSGGEQTWFAVFLTDSQFDERFACRWGPRLWQRIQTACFLTCVA